MAPIPSRLLQTLADLGRRCPGPLYFSGGVVRDWLLGVTPADFDLTIPTGAMAFGRQLALALGAAFVPLSEEEGVARVVWGDTCLDVSQFREGTTSIEADLGRRDFTTNALAVAFAGDRLGFADHGRIIDPLGGLSDLAQGLLRLTHSGAIAADPLRMVRAFRFRALFNWQLEPATRTVIARQVGLISQVSGERIAAELDKTLACGKAFPALAEMEACGLLTEIFPELGPGRGLLQPSSHHLDVLDHSLEACRQMEAIIARPADFFAFPQAERHNFDWRQEITDYLNTPRQTIRLKYAALFHDLGKTVTAAEKDGRMTFYNHDEAGLPLLAAIASRLRWSNEDSRRIGQLVKQHMWPFHLHNARQRTGITSKAIVRLVKAAGDELIGLFFLVMADSLAGQGPGKPAAMEEGVAALFAEVYTTYQERLRPLMATPLLTGHDLIEGLHLSPGPIFRQILDGLLEARAANPAMTKAEALEWARALVVSLGQT